MGNVLGLENILTIKGTRDLEHVEVQPGMIIPQGVILSVRNADAYPQVEPVSNNCGMIMETMNADVFSPAGANVFVLGRVESDMLGAIKDAIAATTPAGGRR